VEEFNNLFLKIEPVVKLAFSEELSVNTGLVVGADPTAGD
jgi:hypothetical protein